jgi:hypothetical protein
MEVGGCPYKGCDGCPHRSYQFHSIYFQGSQALNFAALYFRLVIMAVRVILRVAQARENEGSC